MKEKKNSSKKITSFFSKVSNENLEISDSQIEMSTKIKDVLRNTFKLNDFRGIQEKIIKDVLDNFDVLVIMPTGAGKSLCYQLPAVLDEGVTVVISPLLALIQNQVDALVAKNIKAETINSTKKKSEIEKTVEDLYSKVPTIKLLYVTPELMDTSKFKLCLQHLHKNKFLKRLVVDEAHCISEWGHDFRSSYLKLNYWRDTFKELPITALTATATKSVREEISQLLKLNSSFKSHFSSFNRLNLFYRVFFKNQQNNPFSELLGFLNSLYAARAEKLKEKGVKRERVKGICGIIYCATRQSCDEVSQKLKAQNIKAESYHSGLPDKLRKTLLNNWSSTTAVEDEKLEKQQIDIIVATISFGMGIDKNCVRFVVHWDLSKSFEGYYQESGRAGRDGRLAHCILFYSEADVKRLIYLEANSKQESSRKSANIPKENEKNEQFQKFIAYCENVTICRKKLILEYFEEKKFSKHMKKEESLLICDKKCDICLNQSDVLKLKEKAMMTFSNMSAKTIKFKDSSREGDGNQFQFRDGSFGMNNSKRKRPEEYGLYSEDDGPPEGFSTAMVFKNEEEKRLYLFGRTQPAQKIVKKDPPKKVFSSVFEPEETNHFSKGVEIDDRHDTYDKLLVEIKKLLIYFYPLIQLKEENEIKSYLKEEEIDATEYDYFWKFDGLNYIEEEQKV